ncbi:MAG: pyridoxal phosphate-dependent aminotransferase [Nitrospinae bacterium]|nr:pyridoxal phosphate-dependent aminotransferase [Nitrospinota bacterium]
MKFSKRIQKIKPSMTLAITAKESAMRAKGIDIIGFGAGEPDFDTPENIKEAAVRCLKEGFTKYTPVGGIDTLKEAIIEKFKRDNGLTYNKSEIIVSCGAKHSIYNAVQALFEEGDEVIIPAPYWVSYPDIVTLSGAEPVIVETSEENGFRLRGEDLKQYITSRTKGIILNTPSNPTGGAYTKEDVEEIAAISVERGIFVISDEIYEKIVYDGFNPTSIASIDDEIKDLTVVINGVSKTYSMTGWRIGYTAAHKEIVSAMFNIQSQSTSNPVSISQKAAVEALNGSQDATAIMVEEFRKRRDYIVERLNSIEGVSCFKPLGAFYVFPNISKLYGRRYGDKIIKGSLNMADYLIQEAKVSVVPGIAFGADDFIRLSYATSMENIKRGLDRIEEAIGR